MAPEPIFQAGPVATPFAYTVSGTGEVVPRACQADYDGSGASGDFVPALIFRSQSGHVISRATLGSTVTAGDDAEVSWFPGVKAAAAAASSASAAFARAKLDALGGAPDPAQQVNATGNARASFPHTFTSDATAISWSTAIVTNDTAHLNKVGTYLVWMNTHWDVSSALLTSELIDNSQLGSPHLPNMPTANPPIFDAIGSAQSQDYNVLYLDSPTVSIHVLHQNQTGGNRFVQQAYFSILYVPTA